MRTIGFIGLGSMGAELAGRLLDGNQVYGTNRTKAKASALIERGLIWRDTPREVGTAADVVFSMITDDTALAAITSGPDGILAGANGQGLTLKLAINISLAAQMLAFSEGVLLAERGGIDPELAVRTMAESPIGSPMLRARAPLVLDLPEQAWFDVQLMHKDIRLALQAAHESAAPVPAAAAADRVLSQAEELGYGHRDIAALLEVLAAPGTKPKAA